MISGIQYKIWNIRKWNKLINIWTCVYLVVFTFSFRFKSCWPATFSKSYFLRIWRSCKNGLLYNRWLHWSRLFSDTVPHSENMHRRSTVSWDLSKKNNVFTCFKLQKRSKWTKKYGNFKNSNTMFNFKTEPTIKDG